MLRGQDPRSNIDMGGTREIRSRGNQRITVIAEEVLDIILHMKRIEHDGSKEAPSGLYIYLGYLWRLTLLIPIITHFY